MGWFMLFRAAVDHRGDEQPCFVVATPLVTAPA
jgi:hypothetical protein